MLWAFNKFCSFWLKWKFVEIVLLKHYLGKLKFHEIPPSIRKLFVSHLFQLIKSVIVVDRTSCGEKGSISFNIRSVERAVWLDIKEATR